MAISEPPFPHPFPRMSGYKVAEELYLGSHTAVYRAVQTATQRPVVIKVLQRDYPSFGELVKFRNQYTIAKNLPIPGIVCPLSLETLNNGYALIMADEGGVALEKYSQQRSLELAEVLEIALQLAGILHDLSQHRVVHKDIKPTNILIHPESKEVKLTDFSIASLLPKETQEIQSPNILEGTLAYIAPEQTGRMNRCIDYRADFYSLGVTLYQLLSGTLPFTSDDPLELIHCHLARLPVPVHKVNPAVPGIVSAIVTKLMAKNAEDRYQSALGLKHDLARCLTEWETTGEISEFELGQRDLSDRFLIPEKLYGREAEVQTLLAAFERVAAGATELMLVAGFSGIGKTAVVNEVHKPIVRQKGYFIKGKFDQFNRNIPLSAFVQAFRDLMGQLLSESDEQLAQWRDRILQAVGENGQVLIAVIPELEVIIGKQPAAPELSGTAAQNRFNLLFQKFIQVFTTPTHPLGIFLDDLQWADSASLQLLKLLMEDSGYLLMLGAYRDNEVSPVHPFILMVAELKKTAAIVNKITLAPLKVADTNQLIADTLKCSSALAQPLTELVDRKTKGNPFFITQFLKALHEDGQIRFDRDRSYWECDIAQVNALALTDDVVEFMALQLQKLPAETQHLLKLAACIGNQFDLNTLAIVAERSTNNAATALWRALQEGLILPTSQVYKFFQEEELGDAQSAVNPTYRFLHDRVQQAAYSLISNDQKQTTHYQIGQLLLQKISPETREDHIFELINQLNYGISLITQQAERDQLAQLNFIASRKARNSTAYQAGREYIEIAIALLGENAWRRQYEMSLKFHNLATEIAFLCGEFEEMEQFVETTIAQTKTLLEQINIYQIKIQSNVSQNKLNEAISIGIQILQHLGVTFSKSPTQNDIQKSLVEVGYLVGAREIDDLVHLPIMTDAGKIAILQVNNSITPAAYITGSPLFPLLVALSVKLSIEYGNTSASVLAYISYGIIACNLLQDVDTGVKFGQLAIDLVSKLDAKTAKPEVFSVGGLFILHRKSHIKETLPFLQKGYLTALEVGNLEMAGYIAHGFCLNSFWCGQILMTLEQETRTYCNGLVQFNQLTAANWCRIYWQSILNLLGETEYPSILSGEALQETEFLTLLISSHDLLGLFIFHLYKLLLCYLFGDLESARSSAVESRHYLIAGAGLVGEPIFYFYDSLTILADLNPEALETLKKLQQVEQNQTQLQQQWAHYAPMNHQHKVDLIEAEKCRVLGQKYEAGDRYDRAIAGAQANGFIQEEALANELAAKFYLNWGKEKIAASYMQEAYYGYGSWGAKAKAQDLEQRYPELLAPILQQQQATRSAHETVFSSEAFSRLASLTFGTQFSSSGNTSASATLDLATVLKASQTLSSEIELDQLLATLLHTVLENAGADKGVLLMPHDNQWFVEAVATIDQPAQIQSIALANSSEVPQSLINTVKRSREAVVIVDASAHPTLAMDAYVAQQQSKSLLCTPILNQGKLVAILYLENHVTVGAFTSDRVELLNILCAQAAISLDNARLYQQSQSYAQQLERSLQKLTESESQLQALAENIPGVIFKTGVNLKDGSRFTPYVSSGCYQLYGVTAESCMAGEYLLSDFEHPDDHPKIEQAIQESLENLTPFREEFRIITKTGEIKWIQVVAQPQILPGGFIVSDGVLLDISDRKRLESEQQRLLDVLEATPDYIGLASADGKILWHNKQLRELRQDLVSHKNISECHPAWVNEIILNQVFPILMEQGSWSGELALLDSHGKEIPVSQVIIAHKSKAGEIQYISTIMRDISDRKAYEERLEKTNAELIRATRMKDEFLATMSHELRTPMNAILGMTEILQEEIFGEINEEQMKALATVERSGNHLLELINDILDVSKIASGQIELDYQNTAIIPLCQQSLDFIKPQAAKKSIQTKITLPVDLPSLNIDERRIRQVLINLLNNAVKFTPEGGCITLEVICPITIKQQSYLQINVKDTGIGIAPENLQKVFEPFIQVDSALNRNYEGTGLGLALVKRIVELHQGEVTLTSELGVGSCFAMALPLQLFQSGDDHAV